MSHQLSTRPEPTDYAEYYHKYISKVADGNIITVLGSQIDNTVSFLHGLSEAQAEFRYAPDKWSIGLCLEHLCITNDVYGEAIGGSLTAGPTSPVPEITPGWFSRWFIRSFIAPGPETKSAKAPPKIAPVIRRLPL